MNTYSPTYSDDDDEMGDIVEAYAEQEASDRPSVTDNARDEEPLAWCPGCGDRIPTEIVRERGVCSNCHGTSDDPWAAGRAEAWAEGHRTGWEHCQDGSYGNDYWDDPTPNPYAAARADEEARAAMERRRRHLAEMTRQAFADGLYETSAEDYAEALRHARGKNPAETIEDAAQAIHDRHCTSDNHGPHCMFWDEDYESAEALHARGLLATARTRLTREQIAEHLRKRANDDEDHADRLYVLSHDEWSRWYDEHLTVSHQIESKSLRIEGRPETIADAVLALLRGGVE